MLECILLVVMYAKLLNIIKGLIDPSIEGLSISFPSKEKFLYILVLLCEASNFIVAAPMKTATAPEMCNTIMNHFIGYFGTPYLNSM